MDYHFSGDATSQEVVASRQPILVVVRDFLLVFQSIYFMLSKKPKWSHTWGWLGLRIQLYCGAHHARQRQVWLHYWEYLFSINRKHTHSNCQCFERDNYIYQKEGERTGPSQAGMGNWDEWGPVALLKTYSAVDKLERMSKECYIFYIS